MVCACSASASTPSPLGVVVAPPGVMKNSISTAKDTRPQTRGDENFTHSPATDPTRTSISRIYWRNEVIDDVFALPHTAGGGWGMMQDLMQERGAREKPEKPPRPSSAFAGSIPSRPPSSSMTHTSALTVPAAPNLSSLQRRAMPTEPGPPPSPPAADAPAVLHEIYEVELQLHQVCCLSHVLACPAPCRHRRPAL